MKPEAPGSSPVTWIARHKSKPNHFWLSKPNEPGDQNWSDAFPVFEKSNYWEERAMRAEKALQLLEEKGLLQTLLDMDRDLEAGKDEIKPTVAVARQVLADCKA